MVGRCGRCAVFDDVGDEFGDDEGAACAFAGAEVWGGVPGAVEEVVHVLEVLVGGWSAEGVGGVGGHGPLRAASMLG